MENTPLERRVTLIVYRDKYYAENTPLREREGLLLLFIRDKYLVEDTPLRKKGYSLF